MPGCRLGQPPVTILPMYRMILPICLILATFAPAAAQAPAQAQARSPLPSDRLTGFADTAELALAAPVIVRASITRAKRIGSKSAPDVAAGRGRFLITAAVSNALVAPGGIGGTLQWLWDAPLDSRGRPAQAKGLDVLAFLAVPGSDGSTRLVIRILRPTTSGVVVLCAEGPYLTADRVDVQHFVKSYRTKGK